MSPTLAIVVVPVPRATVEQRDVALGALEVVRTLAEAKGAITALAPHLTQLSIDLDDQIDDVFDALREVLS